jgi:hypothetical protein
MQGPGNLRMLVYIAHVMHGLYRNVRDRHGAPSRVAEFGSCTGLHGFSMSIALEVPRKPAGTMGSAQCPVASPKRKGSSVLAQSMQGNGWDFHLTP